MFYSCAECNQKVEIDLVEHPGKPMSLYWKAVYNNDFTKIEKIIEEVYCSAACGTRRYKI